jgi:hypothetical protein
VLFVALFYVIIINGTSYSFVAYDCLLTGECTGNVHVRMDGWCGWTILFVVVKVIDPCQSVSQSVSHGVIYAMTVIENGMKRCFKKRNIYICSGCD